MKSEQSTVMGLMLAVKNRIPKNEKSSGSVFLNNADMLTLGCNEKDIVKLNGTHESIAQIMVASECEQGTIQMDDFMIRNVGHICSDEMVHISKTQYVNAESVFLVPFENTKKLLQKKSSSSNLFESVLKKRKQKKKQNLVEDDIRQHKNLVEGIPISKGDWIRVTLFGRAFEFVVAETNPSGNVVFTSSTKVSIEGDLVIRAQNVNLSYDDIGGLKKEISKVREMIEVPLHCPQLYDTLGVTPPRGLLLYGPPGCGKTLIARAVAMETGVYFISINGPEIIKQHYGESEGKLREIFEEAEANAPSIIFFDEIDALAPNRETVLGDVEKRVVSQLLTLMDGLKSRGNIVVIAATNLPNNLDPALRRPGRFDREVGINPPDKMGRAEILKIHTRLMPLDTSVDIEEIATITHGFLGADLAALCREAAVCCVRDILPKFGVPDFQFTENEISNIKVKMTHFESALKDFELSTTRELSTDIPDVNWEDIGGLEEIKNILKDSIELPLKYSDRFKEIQVKSPKGILLTGAPGTGKTLLAKALAHESGINFISVKGPELLSKWVGESERGIREIFKKAKQAAPSIIFFDEIDAIVPARSSDDSSSHVGDRIIGQFLLEMDSIENLHGILVLAASNRPDLIDKAMLRPGRFDYILNLPTPDYEARIAILQVFSKGKKIEASVSLENLAKITDGMTGADLEAICRKAAMLAIKESIEKYPDKKYPKIIIKKDHFKTAFEVFKANNF
jgi:transitional endoplasmic reticulum ATPase